jgi:low molecular weight phosphotyrosine protein phosphatase
MSQLLDRLLTSFQIHASDFQKFDFIFAMDRDNLRDLQRIHQRAGGKAKVMLFGEFAGKKRAEEVLERDVPRCEGLKGSSMS